MALTAAGWKSRIETDLQLILGKASAQLQDDILNRALARFIRKVDRPIISASLVVTTSAGPYAVPATIDKLVDIRDAATVPVSVEYSFDSTKNEITLTSEPTAAATYTCYGTPAEVRTNQAAVLAALKDAWEDIVWSYIKGYAFEWANNSEAANMLMYADKLATDERKSRNRRLDTTGVSAKYKDANGTDIGSYGEYGSDL